MADAAGDIIVISSQVARGAVGNRGMGFALERLGFTVWAVPTVLLPYHPGHGRADSIVPDTAAFARQIAGVGKRTHLDGSAQRRLPHASGVPAELARGLASNSHTAQLPVKRIE